VTVGLNIPSAEPKRGITGTRKSVGFGLPIWKPRWGTWKEFYQGQRQAADMAVLNTYRHSIQ
jgi:hypothetical protein